MGPAVKLFLIGCALTCITNIPSGFTHTSINTAVRELTAYLNESYTTRGVNVNDIHLSYLRSTINSCWYAGQVIGALFSAYIADTYGRRVGYIIATAAMTLACGVQAAATLTHYPELLIAGRVLTSIFSPLSDAVLTLYLQECSPTHLRGSMGSLFASGYAAMCLLGMTLGMRQMLGSSLSLLLSVPTVLGIVSLIFLFLIPETPKFLMITRNDREKAMQSIAFFQGSSEFHADRLDEFLYEVEDKSKASPIMDVFRVAHLRAAFILTSMVLMLTLAFYPIVQSSTYILISLELPHSLAQVSSTVMMVVLFVSCAVATVLLERFSRRGLLRLFGFLSVVALTSFVLCGCGSSYYPFLRYGALLSLVGYVIAFGCAIGPISWFIATELVPQQQRANMFCICYGMHSLFVVLTNFFTQPLYRAIGPLSFAVLFIVPSALAVLYIHLYLPETKDREIHDIVNSLKLKRRSMPPVSAPPSVITKVSDDDLDV